MKILKTSIEGLYIFDNLPNFKDLRGKLFKPYSHIFFKENNYENINYEIKEVWFTYSKKDVIRGMHLQIGEFASEKIVSVVKGKILDVVIDLRKNSKTFNNIFEIILTGEDSKAIYIPKGCAHGYKVLEDDTITLYMSSEIHIPSDDVGFRWDSFGYNWEIYSPIISEKDKNLPTLKEFLENMKL